MGRIVSNFFISLDGVVEAPDQWHFPYFDDEMGAVIGAGMGTTGAFLMGRTLYGEWSEYWMSEAVPADDEGFGGFINGVKKYVISSSLGADDVTWHNAELVPGGEGAADRVRAVKEATEGDVTMSGCPTTVRWLISEGLLDELALLVHPIVVDKGFRLFDGTGTVPLKLTSQRALGSGVLHLTYVPDPDPPTAG